MRKTFILMALIAAAYISQAQTQYITDPSFETGGNSPIWNDTNNVDIYGCITSDPARSRTGNHCLAMAVVPLPDYLGTAEQVFTVVNPDHLYNAKLEFYIKCELSSGSSNDMFVVTVNYQFLKNSFITTGLKTDSASIGSAWKKITVNIDTLSLGTNYIKILYGNNILGSTPTPSTPNYCFYYIDDMTITAGYPTAVENSTNGNHINIFPTLVKDNIIIENIEQANCTTVIYNVAGQLMQSNDLSSSIKQEIATSTLMPGMYFLQIKDKQGLVVKRITLQKM